MRILQKLLKQPATTSPGIVAISFLGNGFTIAVTRYTENDRPRLLFCDFISAPQPQWATQLETLIKAHRLENYACHILLSHEQYRTFSIEAPQVHSDEIRQAIHWRIAEMLDYPIDQATIDYYPYPQSNRANSTPMLEVVSCNTQSIAALLAPCKQAGLNIKVIDIQETALRNLATLLPENDQGVAVLHLQQNNGRIIIQKHGAIHLSRKFDLGYGRLYGGGFDEQDRLALEIQRSFDYVENYFDIPPITSLAVVLMPSNTENLISFLMINHGITARALDISAIVEGDTVLNDTLQNLCAPVIGAGLRRFVDARP